MTISQPTFTVLVPTYNQASYIGAALDSLLAQTNPDWEAVVVNDGSTDNTAEIMQAYASQDERIRIFHKENGGTGSALNEGLRHARGKWICWLSSDDLFDSRKLEIHQQYIQQKPETEFFFTHFFLLREETNQIEAPPLWRDIPEDEWQALEMLRAAYVHGISICVKREAMQGLGGFDSRLHYAQDYDMWLRLVTRVPATYIPQRTCIQRIHPGQGSQVFSDIHFFDVSRSAIDVVNHHTFEELVPYVDLSVPTKAYLALEKALDVASNFESRFLYSFGPHPALFWRIVEWVLQHDAGEVNHRYREIVRNKLQSILKRKYLDPSIELQLKAIYAILQLPGGSFHYQPLSVDELAKKRYWQLRAIHKGNYEAILRYLGRFRITPEMLQPISTGTFPINQVVVVYEGAIHPNPANPNDLPPAWTEIASYLARAGQQLLLIGFAQNRLGVARDIPYIGVEEQAELFDLLRLLSPLDYVISCSQATLFSRISAEHPAIFIPSTKQQPDRMDRDKISSDKINIDLGNIDKIAQETVQRRNIPIIVDSATSLDLYAKQGIPQAQLYLLNNDFVNSEFFKTKGVKGYLRSTEDLFWKTLDQARATLKNKSTQSRSPLVKTLFRKSSSFLQKVARRGVWWLRV